MKQLNFNMSVADATNQYPQLIDFIVRMGYPQIRNNVLRNTIGRNYTLNDAMCQLKLDKNKLLTMLRENGFEPVNVK